MTEFLIEVLKEFFRGITREVGRETVSSAIQLFNGNEQADSNLHEYMQLMTQQQRLDIEAALIIGDVQSERNHQNQLELMTEQQRLDIEAAQIIREISLRCDRQLMADRFQQELKLKAQKLANDFELWSKKTDFETCWPITNTYQNSSLISEPNSKNARPVMVFITKPKTTDKYAGLMENVNKMLKSYFSNPLYNSTTENALTSQIGAWKPGFDEDNHINNLFNWLKLQPCVVVNPVFMRNKAEIYISSWSPFYQGDVPLNEKCITLNITDNEIENEDKITYAIALLSGFYADIYHLLETGAKPQMPAVLKDFCSEYKLGYEIPQNIIDSYKAALYGISCTNWLGDKLPLAYLNMAKTFRAIGSEYAGYTAEQLFRKSIGVWASRKSEIKAFPQNNGECLELIKNFADSDDKEFFENVKKWYGDKIPEAISQISFYPSVYHWTKVTNNTLDCRAIAYVNGKFVAWDNYGSMAISTDGVNWKEKSYNSYYDIKVIAYGNDRFIAVCEHLGQMAYSTDGENWKHSHLNGIEAISYGNGRFVAGGDGRMAYSTDGKIWTEVINHPFDLHIFSIVYGNGKFVAGGVSFKSQMAFSKDGINWMEIKNNPFTCGIGAIAFGDGRFVAVGGGQMAYSDDSRIWKEITNHPFKKSQSIREIAFGNGWFVAGEENGQMAYSSDGIIWMEIKNNPFENSIKSITYGSGRFVAVDWDGIIAYSGKHKNSKKQMK